MGGESKHLLYRKNSTMRAEQGDNVGESPDPAQTYLAQKDQRGVPFGRGGPALGRKCPKEASLGLGDVEFGKGRLGEGANRSHEEGKNFKCNKGNTTKRPSKRYCRTAQERSKLEEQEPKRKVGEG